MQKNSGGFPDFSLEEAKKLSNYDAAQQLFALLQSNHGSQLQQAMEFAAAGDYRKVKQILGPLLSDPQTRQMVEKLRE